MGDFFLFDSLKDAFNDQIHEPRNVFLSNHSTDLKYFGNIKERNKDREMSHVYVFPAPVAPYAKMVTFMPSKTSFRKGSPAYSYTPLLSACSSKTASKVK